MSKTKRNTNGKNTVRKKKKSQAPVVELISQLDTSQLNFDNYSDNELTDLFEKVTHVEESLSETLGISRLNCKEILGAKVAQEKQWFLVSWYDFERPSFVPAPVMHRLAPEKVIEFYEARLKFGPDEKSVEEIHVEPISKLLMKKTKSKRRKPKQFIDQTTNEAIHQQQKQNLAISQSEIESEMIAAKLRKTVPQNTYTPPKTKNVQTQQTPNTNNYPITQQRHEQRNYTVSSSQVYAIMNCWGCQQQLQYACGLHMIRCPSCNTIMHTGSNRQ
eukprot:TRINITY_DN12152_c0_g1_i1.p1 TRINITY_DN12152_c0_g1~~TRINITY_DN12152_c0_g1_i1.p1  ORF type:complete len:274 (+),score=51.17 TRINITY_DN12152_c0_g1_i1:78-899(+)